MSQELIIDSKRILRKFCRNNKPFVYIRTKNGLIMKRIIKKYKGRNVKFLFPNKIKITPCVVGLIIGEGYIDDKQFVFANSNDKIIKYVLEFISQFNIYPSFVLEIATKNTDSIFIDKSKTSWEEIINKKISNIRLRKEFNNTTQKGTLHIKCYNSCFAKILNIIIKEIKNRVESNKELSKEYIKGILAAEGNINAKSTTTNCLYMVRISAKKEEERKHYKRCLGTIGIKIYCKDMPTINKNDERAKYWKTKKGRGGAVLINRWLNFYKILSLGLLDIHEDKKRKFIKYFLNNKTTRMILEFEGLPKKWFSMKEFKEIFQLSTKPRCRINKMVALKFLKKKKTNSKNISSKYVYRLTDEYSKFIKKLTIDESC